MPLACWTHRAGNTPGLDLSGGSRPSHSGPGLWQLGRGSGSWPVAARGNAASLCTETSQLCFFCGRKTAGNDCAKRT